MAETAASMCVRAIFVPSTHTMELFFPFNAEVSAVERLHLLWPSHHQLAQLITTDAEHWSATLFSGHDKFVVDEPLHADKLRQCQLIYCHVRLRMESLGDLRTFGATTEEETEVKWPDKVEHNFLGELWAAEMGADAIIMHGNLSRTP